MNKPGTVGSINDMPDPSPRNVTLTTAPPICTDCRWCVIDEELYEEPQCTSPQQVMSLVDGKPRWPECYLQRNESETGITHIDLCGPDGAHFEAKEANDALPA
jgi:hypothetical protein